MSLTVHFRNSSSEEVTPIDISSNTTFRDINDELYPDCEAIVDYLYGDIEVKENEVSRTVVSVGVSGDEQILFTPKLRTRLSLEKKTFNTSTEDFVPNFTVVAKGSIVSIFAEMTFVDQGWGYQKGRIEIEHNGNLHNLSGIADHTVSTRIYDSNVTPLPDFLKKVAAGDEFQIGHVVGGGGGHLLDIKKLECDITYAG